MVLVTFVSMGGTLIAIGTHGDGDDDNGHSLELNQIEVSGFQSSADG